MVGSYSNQCDFYLLSFFCLLKKNEHGWFTLKPITLVCAYIFCLSHKNAYGWFALKPTILFLLILFFPYENPERHWMNA